MPDFPHLPIPVKISGKKKKKKGGGKEIDNLTLINVTENRASHGQNLKENVETISNFWKQNKAERLQEEMPSLPDSYPLFLQIDTERWKPENIETLFGINVISENENGYIIGSSSDIDFKKLRTKIEKFIANDGKYKNSAAKLWEIATGTAWRIEQILSESLKLKWETIEDDQLYVLDISIANYLRMSDAPDKEEDESDEQYANRIIEWKHKYEMRRDTLARERQAELEDFIVNGYLGEFLSSFIDYEDSFDCRVSINGKGLKDFVLNYPYVFDVAEAEEVGGDFNSDIEEAAISSIRITPPDPNSPKICVIDSGIQENHIYLQGIVDTINSKNFIGGTTTSDDVNGGGHGTRVAGRILYGELIPKTGNVITPFWIQNAKILDSSNKLPSRYSPAKLVKEIIEYYKAIGTKIFNHSVNNFYNPCRTKHMSSWAASIDKMTFENDILIIISSGNLHDSGHHNSGILDHLNNGKSYPDYLFEKSSRVADPGQSLLGLTVGSLCVGDFDTASEKSIGKKNDISSFSRSGFGIWDTIKPDVVEYGGDLVISKSPPITLRNDSSISMELLRTNFILGPSFSKDQVGTSFSTPGVTRIAAHLHKLLPSESALLYKVLIANGARWPLESFPSDNNKKEEYLKLFGYGLVSLERSTDNNRYRVTFIGSDKIKPKNIHIYTIKIPSELRRPAAEDNILIEVSLAYKAKPRRTRRMTKSYFSGWAKWESSKLEEPFEHFKERMLQIDEDNNSEEEDNTDTTHFESISWYLGRQRNMGLRTMALNDSTLQKDWVIFPSYKLPTEFSIAITGMQGWEKDPNHEIPYALAVSFEDLGNNLEVYEQIRVENEIEIEQEITV